MKKNDIFELEITGMTDEGDGVGRAESMAIFVPYTIIGEKVRIIIVKVMKNFAYGKLLEVIVPSTHRLKADCPYFYQCGGCQLWHMDYDTELKYKQQKVEDCIRRIGGLQTTVSPIVPSDNTSRYRNKVQLPVSKDGIGFYKRNSHTVIDIQDCLLQNSKATKVVALLREWISKYNIEPYDEETNSGNLRHIYIRSGKSGMLLTLVVREKFLPNTDELINMLMPFNLAGIVLNINPKNTNVVLGKENRLLWGKQSIIDNIGESEFEISPNSFYQVNNPQALKLYTIAQELAFLQGNETLWDLYCGIGTIGQFMAKSVKKIVGIEIVPQAVEDATNNAKRNGIKNAKYFCGAAETIAPSLIKKGYKPDVVILDPPRKGCDEKLLETVIKSAPKRIVYISCKPSTLARDLKYLSNYYTTKQIVPVDLFPRTSHVETVTLLCRTQQ